MVYKDEIWMCGGTSSNQTEALKIDIFRDEAWMSSDNFPVDYASTPGSNVNGMAAVVVNDALFILGKINYNNHSNKIF